MKALLIGILSTALGLGVAIAQDGTTPPAPPQPASGMTRIAPGSVIPVSLSKTVDAKKAKTGDEVDAKVTQDLKSNSGEVILAKDTKVVGHVTEAQARSKEEKESQVGIAFDHAVMRNGAEMQLPMSIQAIIGLQNSGPQNSAGTTGSEGAEPRVGGASTNSNSPRAGGMGGSAPAPTPSASVPDGNTPSDAQAQSHPPITSRTEGVVGITNLKLTTAAPTASQGSLVSSEKNNVKLESGTLMLLRVNP